MTENELANVLDQVSESAANIAKGLRDGRFIDDLLAIATGKPTLATVGHCGIGHLRDLMKVVDSITRQAQEQERD